MITAMKNKSLKTYPHQGWMQNPDLRTHNAKAQPQSILVFQGGLL